MTSVVAGWSGSATPKCSAPSKSGAPRRRAATLRPSNQAAGSARSAAVSRDWRSGPLRMRSPGEGEHCATAFAGGRGSDHPDAGAAVGAGGEVNLFAPVVDDRALRGGDAQVFCARQHAEREHAEWTGVACEPGCAVVREPAGKRVRAAGEDCVEMGGVVSAPAQRVEQVIDADPGCQVVGRLLVECGGGGGAISIGPLPRAHVAGVEIVRGDPPPPRRCPRSWSPGWPDGSGRGAAGRG
jgi:hypothetical protein